MLPVPITILENLLTTILENPLTKILGNSLTPILENSLTKIGNSLIKIHWQSLDLRISYFLSVNSKHPPDLVW